MICCVAGLWLRGVLTPGGGDAKWISPLARVGYGKISQETGMHLPFPPAVGVQGFYFISTLSHITNEDVHTSIRCDVVRSNKKENEINPNTHSLWRAYACAKWGGGVIFQNFAGPREADHAVTFIFHGRRAEEGRSQLDPASGEVGGGAVPEFEHTFASHAWVFPPAALKLLDWDIRGAPSIDCPPVPPGGVGCLRKFWNQSFPYLQARVWLPPLAC